MQIIKTVFITLLFIFSSIIFANAQEQESPPKTDSKIYKYTDNKGVTVFTNNIESVPEAFRNRVKVLEVVPQKEIKKTFAPPDMPVGLNNPFIRNILIAVAAIVLFWLIKLWIKNMILKFIARIAIKVALVGLFYMLAHQWFFSSEKVSFFKTVQKTVAPYRDIIPIQKATEGIKAFNKKEKEKKKILEEAVP